MPSPLRAVLCLLVLVAMSAVADLAAANDTAFGGSAAALVPIEQTDVQMRSERIVMTAHPVEVRWDVSARYEFVNHGTEAVKLQVGFPELRCPGGAEYCSTGAFQRLTTRIDGQLVKHRKGKVDLGHEWNNHLGTVWLFDATFPPGKTVVIEHAYSVPGVLDSMGHRYLTYVTRTGQTWAKTIEKAEFVVRLPPFTHTVLAARGKGVTGQPPRVATDGRVEFVAKATNWVPDEDIEIGFNSSSPMTVAGTCRWTNEPEDAQLCINAFYASKGYPFKSLELRKTYYSGNPKFTFDPVMKQWERQTPPQPGFTTEWFEPWESSRLRQLQKQVKEQRATQGQATKAVEVLPAAPTAAASSRTTSPFTQPSATASTRPGPSTRKAPTPRASASSAPTPAPATPTPATPAPKRTTLCQATPGASSTFWTPLATLALLLAIAALRRVGRSDTSALGSPAR